MNIRHSKYILKIAYTNIVHRVYRSSIMIFFVFMLSTALFASAVLLGNLQNGIVSTVERLGADVIVVPERYCSSVEGALFKGEPSTIYFQRQWQYKLSGIEGVDKTSSQLFLATLSADCCEAVVQLIAFDEDTDFVIKPWISQKLNRNMRANEAVVGCNVGLEVGAEAKYYGEDFKIVGKLDKSGMGYDNCVFINYSGADRVINSESAKNFLTISGDEELVSLVNIKAKAGYEADDIKANIQNEFNNDGIAVYTADSLMGNISESFNRLTVYSNVLIGITVLLCVVALFSIFIITINEREREFGILISFGANRSQVSAIIVSEAVIISLIGALTGVVVSSIILLGFGNYISQILELPYLSVSLAQGCAIAIICILIAILTGVAAAIYAVNRIIKKQGAWLIKEGE